jgi:hypothetical protein
MNAANRQLAHEGCQNARNNDLIPALRPESQDKFLGVGRSLIPEFMALTVPAALARSPDMLTPRPGNY